MDKDRPVVFLVDDDDDDLVILQEVISTINPSVQFETATNGGDALNRLDKLPQLPDIIFLDVNMPRMDGKECLDRLLDNPKLLDLPIVMYSTAFEPKFLERKAPNLLFMEKQISMDAMSKEIKEVLDRFLTHIDHWSLLLCQNSVHYLHSLI